MGRDTGGGGTELDKVGLVLLVAGCDQAVDLGGFVSERLWFVGVGR